MRETTEAARDPRVFPSAFVFLFHFSHVFVICAVRPLGVLPVRAVLAVRGSCVCDDSQKKECHMHAFEFLFLPGILFFLKRSEACTHSRIQMVLCGTNGPGGINARIKVPVDALAPWQ